jgi:hypothetical protein
MEMSDEVEAPAAAPPEKEPWLFEDILIRFSLESNEVPCLVIVSVSLFGK